MPTDSLVQGRLSEQLQAVVAGYFAIDTIRFDVPFGRFEHAIRLSGRFLTPTSQAYDAIAAGAEAYHLLVFFRKEAKEAVIYAVQGALPTLKPRWGLAIALFLATLASIFITGGLQQEAPGAPITLDWRSGVSLALPLASILLAHELGHFFVGRRYRMGVSPPYFIPLPASIFGTLGAFILMLAPAKNRRQLLQMGAAGPLAGLALTIPILIYGLATSAVGPLPKVPFSLEGNSLFYGGLKWLLFGQWLPGNGVDVQLNNIAFAGWVGLFITGLNLIPAGQLDGGHAALTLFGERVRPLTWVIIGALVALALATQAWNWLIFAALLLFLGRVYATPMDDLTPLDRKHKILAGFLLVLFVLLFTPIPWQVIVPG